MYGDIKKPENIKEFDNAVTSLEKVLDNLKKQPNLDYYEKKITELKKGADFYRTNDIQAELNHTSFARIIQLINDYESLIRNINSEIQALYKEALNLKDFAQSYYWKYVTQNFDEIKYIRNDEIPTYILNRHKKLLTLLLVSFKAKDSDVVSDHLLMLNRHFSDENLIKAFVHTDGTYISDSNKDEWTSYEDIFSSILQSLNTTQDDDLTYLDLSTYNFKLEISDTKELQALEENFFNQYYFNFENYQHYTLKLIDTKLLPTDFQALIGKTRHYKFDSRVAEPIYYIYYSPSTSKFFKLELPSNNLYEIIKIEK